MGTASELTKDERRALECRLKGTNRFSSCKCSEVATAVWLSIPVLWDVAISPLEGSCRPLLQDTCTWRSVTSQKTGMFKYPYGISQVRKGWYVTFPFRRGTSPFSKIFSSVIKRTSSHWKERLRNVSVPFRRRYRGRMFDVTERLRTSLYLLRSEQ